MKRIQDKLGTAGLIVAVVALVAALGGSAIAANQATDSAKKRNHKAKKNKKKKQKGLTVAQVRKIAKQEARKFANSNPGPAGPQGPAGPAGANGNDGQNGSNGSNGDNGISATAVDYTGAECEEASGESGIEVTSAGSPQYVCNGEDGTFEASGFTQTGVWTVASNGGGNPFIPDGTTTYLPIGFSIPLASAPTFVAVKGAEDKSADGCDGVIDGVPTADPGVLCVYLPPPGFTAGNFNFTALDPTSETLPPSAGTSKAGILLKLVCTEIEFGGCAPAEGTWAVTGS